MARAPGCGIAEQLLRLVPLSGSPRRIEENKGLFRYFHETDVPEALLPALRSVLALRSKSVQASLNELYRQCQDDSVDHVTDKKAIEE